MERSHVVIVDGYKFSKDFVDSVKAQGHDCLHVYSSQTLIPLLVDTSTYDPNDFTDSYVYDGDDKRLHQWLDQFNIVASIPATEPGVILADKIAEYCDCPHNVLKHSLARRDKYLMVDTMHAAGVPTPWYKKVDDIGTLCEWVAKEKSYPLVIKPVAEAGTSGVSIISDQQQLKNTIKTLHNKKGIFKDGLDELFIEECLNGEEYVVNTVSHHGKHTVTDFWIYHKDRMPDGRVLYDRVTMLPKNFEHADVLTDYVFKSLDALGVRFGAAHSEIMLTKKGPRVVEINSRVSGIHSRDIWQRCLGYDQIDLCVQAYLNSSFDFSDIEKRQDLLAHTVILKLQNQKTGEVIGLPDPAVIESRPSHYEHHIYYSIGDKIAPTTDLTDIPGQINLLHADAKTVEADYSFIKQYCKENVTIK